MKGGKKGRFEGVGGGDPGDKMMEGISRGTGGAGIRF